MIIMSKKPVLSSYTIKTNKLSRKTKIAFLADLHERPWADLLPLVKRINPDIILIAGDTFERYDKTMEQPEERKRGFFARIIFNIAYYFNYINLRIFCRKTAPDTERTYGFLRELCKNAPVVSSLGNHEERFLKDDLKLFDELGITLLDNSDKEFVVKGERIRIGGLSTAVDENWLSGFSKKSGLKILLSHHPIYYDRLIADKDFDLVLSGHNHGGQIRYRNKGILSSGEGFFPKYDKGIYHGRFIVTAGCANTVAMPRINNPREIVRIELE